MVRIIVSGTEFRNDAAQLHSHNVQLPLQLQVCLLLALQHRLSVAKPSLSFVK